jgi:hypothetical protein
METLSFHWIHLLDYIKFESFEILKFNWKKQQLNTNQFFRLILLQEITS